MGGLCPTRSSPSAQQLQPLRRDLAPRTSDIVKFRSAAREVVRLLRMRVWWSRFGKLVATGTDSEKQLWAAKGNYLKKHAALFDHVVRKHGVLTYR